MRISFFMLVVVGVAFLLISLEPAQALTCEKHNLNPNGGQVQGEGCWLWCPPDGPSYWCPNGIWTGTLVQYTCVDDYCPNGGTACNPVQWSNYYLINDCDCPVVCLNCPTGWEPQLLLFHSYTTCSLCP